MFRAIVCRLGFVGISLAACTQQPDARPRSQGVERRAGPPTPNQVPPQRPEGTDCEVAYGSLIALHNALKARVSPEQLAQMQAVPRRERYIAACETLPPVVQRCLSMQYAASHQAECQNARLVLSPEASSRFRELARGE